MLKLLAVIVSLLFSQGAFAHHLWIEKEGTLFKVLWGHPPESTPYEAEKLKEIKVFDSDGKEAPLTRKNEKDGVYLSAKEDVSMIAVSFEGGYLVTTPDGKKKVTKREAERKGLQIIDSVYSTQYAKGLFECSENITKESGLKFEIVPLRKPCRAKPGETIPLRIYFDGKPVEGATVETGNHAGTGKSSQAGIFNFKVTEKGMHIILAKHRLPVKDNPDTNYLSYTTVLTFTVK